MKNFLVVGGSSGIGQALVQQLAEEGNTVYSTYCKHPVESAHPITYRFLDVRQQDFSLDFLPDALDGVAYCPGAINLLPFARIRPSDYVADFELQVVGAVKVLQHVLPRLKTASQASVVLFSTVAVQHGFAFHTQVAASKGAVEGLARSLAAELAPGIRVNAIAPSIVDTSLAGRLLNSEEKKHANAQRHPLKRIGRAADIASMAAFLLSDESSWITGQVITVDGGISTLKL